MTIDFFQMTNDFFLFATGNRIDLDFLINVQCKNNIPITEQLIIAEILFLPA
jgi:hypothetical protein